jgi:uncharacterized membrane protein YjjB (DUF3815 family)
MLLLLREMALAMIATLGFAVLFNAPRRVVLLCAIIGGVAFGVRQSLMELGVSQNLATLVSALVIGVIGELSARHYRVPALVFMVTGFVPLIPGALSYRTVLDVLNGNYSDGLVNGVRTGLLAGAIAGGIGTATALFRLRERPR